MQIRIRRVDWEYKTSFRIAYQVQTHAETVVVELEEGTTVARGEAVGVSYHNETAASLVQQLNAFAGELRNGVTRADLQALLPPGGARNAVDCALWDMEAKRAGRRAWELAGMHSVRPLLTSYTFGIDAPEVTARSAAQVPQYSLLKIKLSGESDLERVTLVRKARPDARLIVDANQAWNEAQLRELTPRFAELGVELIEQPLPVGKDAALLEFNSPVPLCADESCQTSASLPAVIGKYQFINIKLDKSGGLTEALRMAQLAQQQGLKLMVGCLGGSSLAMAPAFIVGQLCDFVDLDSPLLSKADVPNAIRYDGNRMGIPGDALWG